MGIYNALYTSASGLSAFGNAISVVGDNIANVNSLGFKSQNVNFADVFGQTVGVTKSSIANQVGNGVSIGSITRDMSQGSVETTSTSTDMAINGTGMFVLKDPSSGSTVYSRAGAFITDNTSNLVNAQGYQVQGWALDSSGNTTGGLSSISLGNLQSSASATTSVNVAVNLDATSSTIPSTTTFSPTNSASYNYKQSATVYDSLGTAHTVDVYFAKMGNDSSGNAVWDYHLTVDGSELTGGTAGVQTEPVTPTPSTVTGGVVTTYGSQTLVFNTSGALDTEISPTTTFNWSNAASGSISVNFGNAITTDAQGITGTGTNGTVQLASASAPISITADGYPAGSLSSLTTSSTGVITGVFTNGQQRPLFQLALASIPDPAVMDNIGNNMFQQTSASGTPVIEQPGNAGMGTIQSNALEQSNVDLANEFTKLVTIQNSYEANSKTLVTTNQMLSTLMSVIR